MGLNTSLSGDLPNMYTALADAYATYNGVEIGVFFDDDFTVGGISDKLIKVQSSDVVGLADGHVFEINGVTYEVLNHNPTETELETIVALDEVE